MSEIKKTKDFSMFKKHENNREIDQGNLRRIKSSINITNLLKYRPILVDAQMRIIDGQHRLEAAKALGLEIYYQVQADAYHEHIVLLNTNQKNWQIEDYVNYYISRGNKEYLFLKEFAQENDIRLSTAFKLLKNHNEGDRKKFKEGKLEFSKDEKYSEVKEALQSSVIIIDKCKNYLVSNPLFLNSIKFKKALVQFLLNKEVDFNIFVNKITYKAQSIHPCASIVEYTLMLGEIYNWKNQNPIEI